MENFLAKYFTDQKFQSEKMAGDGGHRSYTRLTTEQKDSYILMNSGHGDLALKEFVSIREKLRQAACFVPKIFQTDFSKGLLLMEDLGREDLEKLQSKKGNKVAYPYYLKALKQLINLQQQIKISPTDIVFDKEFFLEEVDIAVSRLEDLLKIISQKESSPKPPPSSKQLKTDMKKIISQFVEAPVVYCHRDFHCKNMMIHNGELYLLDFQDAGAGPWMYDLTSLVYDSYATFTDLERQSFIKFYFENSEVNFQKGLGHFKDMEFFVQLQFLQRGLKACGCFAGFYNNNQKATHLKYIKPTLQILYNVAQNLNFKDTAYYFKQLKNQINLKFFDEISKNTRYSF